MRLVLGYFVVFLDAVVLTVVFFCRLVLFLSFLSSFVVKSKVHSNPRLPPPEPGAGRVSSARLVGGLAHGHKILYSMCIQTCVVHGVGEFSVPHSRL